MELCRLSNAAHSEKIFSVESHKLFTEQKIYLKVGGVILNAVLKY